MLQCFYFFVRFASTIDSQLEEEEQYADQLKEYYAFGDSVRLV